MMCEAMVDQKADQNVCRSRGKKKHRANLTATPGLQELIRESGSGNGPIDHVTANVESLIGEVPLQVLAHDLAGDMKDGAIFRATMGRYQAGKIRRIAIARNHPAAAGRARGLGCRLADSEHRQLSGPI